MKKTFSLLVGLCFVLTAFSQASMPDSVANPNAPWIEKPPVDMRKTSISFGVLQGGGSLLGADLEYMLSSKTGIQAGMGLSSFGFGVNIHLKPGIRTSYINLGYWHQGIGPNHVQTIIGPSYVYRAKKIFTCQIGYGFIIDKGPKYPTGYESVTSALLYSVGLYFPI